MPGIVDCMSCFGTGFVAAEYMMNESTWVWRQTHPLSSRHVKCEGCLGYGWVVEEYPEEREAAVAAREKAQRASP